MLRRETAPRYKRTEGITSYLLASARTCAADHLTITMVEIEPGGEQRIHSHPPEQIYYMLEGSGLMIVDGETLEVNRGDCIFVPSGRPHGLRNQSPERLRYLSAAAPTFNATELTSLWPLPSEAEEQAGSK